MNTIFAVFENNKLVIFIWTMLALALSFFYPLEAALVYAALIGFIAGRRCPKKVISAMLAACIASQSQAVIMPVAFPVPVSTNTVQAIPCQQPGTDNGDDPQFLAPCIAITVLVVGAVVIYQLVKFCQKYLPPPPPPPPTNNVPNPTNSIPTNFPVVTIASNLSIAMPGPRTFTMLCTIAPNGTMSLSTPSANAYWSDDNGITASNYFASLPTNAAPVNIGYNAGVISITEPGQATRTIVLDRSSDGINWTPIATNVWSTRFTTVSEVDADAPETQAFYRVR